MNAPNNATCCCNSNSTITFSYSVRYQSRYNHQPLCSDRVHTEYILLRVSMAQYTQQVIHTHALYAYYDHSAICSDLTA
jgi:hypothetical protein